MSTTMLYYVHCIVNVNSHYHYSSYAFDLLKCVPHLGRCRSSYRQNAGSASSSRSKAAHGQYCRARASLFDSILYYMPYMGIAIYGHLDIMVRTTDSNDTLFVGISCSHSWNWFWNTQTLARTCDLCPALWFRIRLRTSHLHGLPRVN